MPCFRESVSLALTGEHAQPAHKLVAQTARLPIHSQNQAPAVLCNAAVSPHLPEGIQGFKPLCLRQVAVELSCRRQLRQAKLQACAVSSLLGGEENDGAPALEGVRSQRQQSCLLAGGLGTLRCSFESDACKHAHRRSGMAIAGHCAGSHVVERRSSVNRTNSLGLPS